MHENSTGDREPARGQVTFTRIADVALDRVLECTPSACKMWLVLCKHRNWGSGEVRRSVAGLAALSGLSAPTVVRALRELRGRGLVEFEPVRNRVTTYRVIGALARRGGRSVEARDRADVARLAGVDNQAEVVDNSTPGGPEVRVGSVKKSTCRRSPGGKKCSLTPREKLSPREKQVTVSSNPKGGTSRAVEIDELLPDPIAVARRVGRDQGRLIAEAGSADVAGRYEPATAEAEVREEVRAELEAGATVGEIIREVLAPWVPVDAIPGALPSLPLVAPDPAPVRRLWSEIDLVLGGDAARNVEDLLSPAVAVGEMTGWVVDRVIPAVVPGVDVPTLAVEAWTWVRVQRMSRVTLSGRMESAA